MRRGGHLNLIWKGILLRMYAQQPPVELLHQCESEAGTDKDESNKKGRKSINEHKASLD